MADLDEIKDINADLPLTKFPDEIDDLENFSDADDEINSAIVMYKNYIKQGETSKAEEIYEKYSLKKYIVSAHILNKIQQMIIACERSISSVKKYFSFSVDAPTGTTSQPNGYIWGKVLSVGDYFKKVLFKLKENGTYVDIYPQTTADNVLITEGDTKTLKNSIEELDSNTETLKNSIDELDSTVFDHIHTHYYAGSTNIGGSANSANALINSNAWGDDETLRVQYAQNLDGSCTQNDYIACLVNGWTSSGVSGTEKTYYLHSATLGDMLDIEGIGKTLWLNYQVTPVLDEFSFSLSGTNMPITPSNGQFTLPAGIWLLLIRISTSSNTGMFRFSIENKITGVIEGEHTYSKTIPAGTFQTFEGFNIPLTVDSNTPYGINIETVPELDGATSTYFNFAIYAVKLR